MIEWRRSLPGGFRQRADAAIGEALEVMLDHTPFATFSSFGAFWPVRGEPDLREYLGRLHARGYAVALPRVLGTGAGLEFGRWTPGAPMHVDRFGIPVPEPFEPLDPELLIVPCVGFDARGYRLGYGGGHYDRTLAARRLPAIGVSYDEAELEHFEAGAHDLPLDAIVTELRAIRPR